MLVIVWRSPDGTRHRESVRKSTLSSRISVVEHRHGTVLAVRGAGS